MQNQCSITEQRPLPDHNTSKMRASAARRAKASSVPASNLCFGKRVTIKNFVRASFDFGGSNALRQRISQLDFVVRSWPDGR
jgi:hypothetical protein